MRQTAEGYNHRGPGEIEVQSGELARQLPRIVSASFGSSSGDIDDACQDAWQLYLCHADEVEVGSELSWLTTAATREAIRRRRARRREVSYEHECESGAFLERPDMRPGPARVVELRERLATIQSLPVRERRMLLMHGYGYRYAEIAERTGDSRRTVERVLLRAKQRIDVTRETSAREARYCA